MENVMILSRLSGFFVIIRPRIIGAKAKKPIGKPQRFRPQKSKTRMVLLM